MRTPNYIDRYNDRLKRAFLRRLSKVTPDGRELSEVKVNAKGELVR